MPDTDLESLIARAESGDWGAVGEILEYLHRKHKRMFLEITAWEYDWQVEFGYPFASEGDANSLPAAIARAARATLEGGR